MFCPNCGKPVQQGSRVCPHCRKPVVIPGARAPAPQGMPPGVPVPRKSRMATASLVFGIGGVFTAGILGVIGVVLGIVALMEIDKSKKSVVKIGGTGQAIGGIVAGGFSMVIVFMIWFLVGFFSGMIKFDIHGRQEEAKKYLKEIHSAQSSCFSNKERYGITFEEIEWMPQGKQMYSYFLSPEEFINANKGGPYNIPEGVRAFVDDQAFQAIAVGNIDQDETLDVWMINQDKKMYNLLDDRDDMDLMKELKNIYNSGPENIFTELEESKNHESIPP